MRQDEKPPEALSRKLPELDPQYEEQMQTGDAVERTARRWIGSTLDDGRGSKGTIIGHFPAKGDPDDDDFQPAEYAVRVGNQTRVADLQADQHPPLPDRHQGVDHRGLPTGQRA